MFTGLIEGVGYVAVLEPRGGDMRLRIAAGTLPFDSISLGESIAVWRGRARVIGDEPSRVQSKREEPAASLQERAARKSENKISASPPLSDS